MTRPKAQSEGLVAKLQALGATAYVMPVIEIRALDSNEALDAALSQLDSYDWVILTSVNGVKAVENRMTALKIPAEKLSSRKLAAIGPATAAELERFSRKPDLIPDEYVSEAIAEAIERVGAPTVRGPGRFLLARADIARKDLADLLRAQGAQVDEVAAYRIVRGEGGQDLPSKAPDYITLTSSSAARSTFQILKENGHESWMTQSALVCIGPITSGTVREMGFEVAVEAGEYTVTGLLQALVQHVKKEAIRA
ncbi:MAG: uroporphyrinogen-III synthase [Fimbriimonadales bacterium]